MVRAAQTYNAHARANTQQHHHHTRTVCDTNSYGSIGTISFSVTSSLDQQKTTWRAEGPQPLFITPMVDFFVRVGAPDACVPPRSFV